jgi:hypothetical protein
VRGDGAAEIRGDENRAEHCRLWRDVEERADELHGAERACHVGTHEAERTASLEHDGEREQLHRRIHEHKRDHEPAHRPTDPVLPAPAGPFVRH